jgi:hypothetical protein
MLLMVEVPEKRRGKIPDSAVTGSRLENKGSCLCGQKLDDTSFYSTLEQFKVILALQSCEFPCHCTEFHGS